MPRYKYTLKDHPLDRECEKWSISRPCVIAPVLMWHLTMAFCSLFLWGLMKRCCHYCLSSEFGDPFKHDCLTRAWLPATPSERACPCCRWTNIQAMNSFWSRPLQCRSHGRLSGPGLIRPVQPEQLGRHVSSLGQMVWKNKNLGNNDWKQEIIGSLWHPRYRRADNSIPTALIRADKSRSD